MKKGRFEGAPSFFSKSICLRFQSGLNLIDNSGESRGLIHRHIGKDLAVQSDAGLIQAVHKSGIRQSVFADAGVDALDPQSAEVAFFLAAVAVSVLQAFFDLFQSDAIQFGIAFAISLRQFQNLFVFGMSRYTAFYTSHFLISLPV